MVKTHHKIPTSLQGSRYVLGEVLGEGGMAVVCRAKDTKLGVERAIKVLLPQHGGRSTIRRRLNQEARAMAAIRHPNVLGIHDVGQEGEFDFVVMDIAEGGSLQDLVQKGPLPCGMALRYAVQVLSALASAHAAGIVHRDVKPHNILLDSNGRALLADFGIALLVESERRTRTGVAMGSLAFMPPEQRLDAARVGPAADIYATGSTLYNLITGRNPVDLFLADNDHERFEGIAAPIAQVILKACQMRPADRYATAGEMARAIVTVLESSAPDTLRSIHQPPEESLFPEPSHVFTGATRDRTTAQSPNLSDLALPVAQATQAAITFLDNLPTDDQATLHRPQPAPEPEPEKRRLPVVLLVFIAISLLSLAGLIGLLSSKQQVKNPAQVIEPIQNPEPLPLPAPTQPPIQPTKKPIIAPPATQPNTPELSPPSKQVTKVPAPHKPATPSTLQAPFGKYRTYVNNREYWVTVSGSPQSTRALVLVSPDPIEGTEHYRFNMSGSYSPKEKKLLLSGDGFTFDITVDPGHIHGKYSVAGRSGVVTWEKR